MGNGSSVASNVNKQTNLIQEIHAVGNELAETYKSKYLDPKFCTRIALIYNDKLMNFRKQDLNNIAMTLGLVADSPRQKQQLCGAIIKHYTDRLNLVAAIQNSLNFCSNRIIAISTGPRCEGNPEIFDQELCSKSGSRWINYVVPPDESIEENKQWYNYLAHMQETYLKALARMLDILKQLRDFDEDITDERLKVLGLEVEELINGMEQSCYQLYKLMLTTPTYTEAELNMKQEGINIGEQEAAARLAALRASRGLTTIAES